MTIGKNLIFSNNLAKGIDIYLNGKDKPITFKYASNDKQLQMSDGKSLLEPFASKIADKDLVIRLEDSKHFKTDVLSACCQDFKSLQSVSLEGISAVYESAFMNCESLSDLHLPNLVKLPLKNAKQGGAFMNCVSLSAVDLPNLTNVGVSSFANCTNLYMSADQFKKFVEINQYAFANDTSLPNDISLDSLTTLGHFAFKGCAQLSAIHGNQITALNDGCLNGCTGLSIVDFPKLKKIDNGNALAGMHISAFSFPELTSAGTGAFSSNTNLISVYAPQLNTLGTSIFNGCRNLEHLDIDYNQVTTITPNAFNGCARLIVLAFPNVSLIRENAFSGCTQLSTLVLSRDAGDGSVVVLSAASAFKNTNSLSIFVPDSLLDTYKATAIWNDASVVGKLHAISELPA